MSKKIFVNLPVKDLQRTIEFFNKLGFQFNPQFNNEKAGCMVISDDIFVMLLTEEFFQTFVPGPVSDATKSSEVIISLNTDSRAAVDEWIENAIAAGATAPMPANDHGFMYQRGFRDLDGHLWEVFWMKEG